jgi:hypothetical protein
MIYCCINNKESIIKEEDLVIGKIYNYCDDGKHSESRIHDVLLAEKIPFKNADKALLEEWKQEKEECYWLYADKTDYFIKGVIKFSDNKEEDVCFVRTKYNGWFSMGFWAGSLEEKIEA